MTPLSNSHTPPSQRIHSWSTPPLHKDGSILPLYILFWTSYLAINPSKNFNAVVDYYGKQIAINGEGDGVFDGFVVGLKHAINIDLEIMEYGEHELGQGADAEAVTYIQLKCGGRRYSGVAISKDIIASSLNAFMGAPSLWLSTIPVYLIPQTLYSEFIHYCLI
mgnify:CR=1 FL=1